MCNNLQTISLALLASAGAACATVADTTDVLANGLNGLDKRGDANWNFASGILEANAGSAPSLMITREDYKDFELTLDVFVSVEHNSGVFIRCSDRANITATNCYEINIFDKRPDQSGRTGGAPGYFKPLAQVDAGGKWNIMKIRAQGAHIFASINGVTTIDSDGPLLANGPIALQWGAGDVKFRNVRIRRLD
jgi:Domain of Unknown Function (DUF1080)